MDRQTIDIYESSAEEWLDRRPLGETEAARARAFGEAVPDGAPRVDLGCGPGRHALLLGEPVIVVDAAFAMVALARQRHGPVPGVQADLAALPFRPHALGGGWGNCSYQHVPRSAMPLALAELHVALAVGGRVAISVHHGDLEGHRPGGDFPGRYFAYWKPDALTDLLVGAGFDGVNISANGFLFATATRARSLPDTVGEGMRVLVCGLNPSVYAADAGAGYARPTNRFWTAAIEAGLAAVPADGFDALRRFGTGMTDLVKRATPRSSELTRAEYRDGAARVRRLVKWLRPDAICFVGLEGFRAAVDPNAVTGVQPRTFGGRPVYVMPSTSGINAGTRPPDFVAHLRAAAQLADNAR